MSFVPFGPSAGGREAGASNAGGTTGAVCARSAGAVAMMERPSVAIVKSEGEEK
jgi:hypothetical protein